MSKQTVVELLREKYINNNGVLTVSDFDSLKQVEKDNLDEAFTAGVMMFDDEEDRDFQDWYNETYQ